MITRFVIEGLIAVALVIGFCFEEKIALAERRLIKKLFYGRELKKQREERAKRMLREARYIRAQREREMELLELGLDPRPSLKVIRNENEPVALNSEEEIEVA